LKKGFPPNLPPQKSEASSFGRKALLLSSSGTGGENPSLPLPKKTPLSCEMVVSLFFAKGFVFGKVFSEGKKGFLRPGLCPRSREKGFSRESPP